MKRRSAGPELPPDLATIALGIRQPWVELILRGVKTIEVRTQNTRVRGTIHLYASKKFSDLPVAHTTAVEHGVDAKTLPCGLLVGSVELCGSRPATARDAAASCVPASLLAGKFAWELRNPRRFERPLPVKFLPYGVWFYPFQRRG